MQANVQAVRHTMMGSTVLLRDRRTRYGDRVTLTWKPFENTFVVWIYGDETEFHGADLDGAVNYYNEVE